MDIVITYVNGLDPEWQRQYSEHAQQPMLVKRYRDWGTLRYLLRGIEQCMPFVRKVFLVVSSRSQVPQWADTEQLVPVLHSDIMPAHLLPTFNSTAIEMFLHRIPGLDEEFIYFNDDFFPVLPFQPTDFFLDGKAVAGHSASRNAGSLYLQQTRNADRLARRAAGLAPAAAFVRPQHTVTTMLRSESEELYRKEEAAILASVTTLREPCNLNQYLYSDYLYYRGLTVQKRLSNKHFSLAVAPIGRICAFLRKPSRALVCINDVQLGERRFQRYRRKLLAAFQERFPHPSKYELRESNGSCEPTKNEKPTGSVGAYEKQKTVAAEPRFVANKVSDSSFVFRSGAAAVRSEQSEWFVPFPIDAVIPWVDGDDPAHRERRQRYGDAKALARQDVGGDIRFSSIGEIYWCVASLNRYAPFLHKIYLVTDGQDPHLGPYLDKLFPEGSIPIEVVDHSVLFTGYEEYLPVFNSRAIETMLHRIPGLAEHYVLLNDDFLLTAPVQPTDFFTADGKPVLYANRFSTTWARFLYGLKPVRDGRPKATFKRSLLRAVERVGHCPTFFYLTHTPRALTKSFFQEYYAAHPDAIEQNIRHRFRDAAQYNPQELYYLTEARRGAIKRIPNGKKNFYLMPKGDEAYTRRKLERLEQGDYLFCCFNSLEQGSEQERQLIVDWVKSHLALR